MRNFSNIFNHVVAPIIDDDDCLVRHRSQHFDYLHCVWIVNEWLLFQWYRICHNCIIFVLFLPLNVCLLIGLSLQSNAASLRASVSRGGRMNEMNETCATWSDLSDKCLMMEFRIRLILLEYQRYGTLTSCLWWDSCHDDIWQNRYSCCVRLMSCVRVCEMYRNGNGNGWDLDSIPRRLDGFWPFRNELNLKKCQPNDRFYSRIAVIHQSVL